jgi:hypothetical protein
MPNGLMPTSIAGFNAFTCVYNCSMKSLMFARRQAPRSVKPCARPYVFHVLSSGNGMSTLLRTRLPRTRRVTVRASRYG